MDPTTASSITNSHPGVSCIDVVIYLLIEESWEAIGFHRPSSPWRNMYQCKSMGIPCLRSPPPDGTILIEALFSLGHNAIHARVNLPAYACPCLEIIMVAPLLASICLLLPRKPPWPMGR